MNTFKQITQNLGLEDWIIALTGLASITISISSFFGYLPLDQKQTSSILIGAVGLLMVTVVVQTAMRQKENLNLQERIEDAELKLRNSIEHVEAELKDTFGIAETELMNWSEFLERLSDSVERTKTHIHEVFLLLPGEEHTLPGYYSKSSSPTELYFARNTEYKETVARKVKEDGIVFKRVQFIPNRRVLEETIFRLLYHSEGEYYIRYCEAPKEPVPLLNIISFDYREFYLSYYHPHEPAEERKLLYIREKEFTEFFKSYRSTTWFNALPLNGPHVPIFYDAFDKVIDSLGKNIESSEEGRRQVVDVQQIVKDIKSKMEVEAISAEEAP